MKRSYLVKCLSFLVLIFAITGNIYAQTTITGNVTDAKDGTPLPGVNVFIKGTTQGTTTNIEGNYSIAVPADAETLTFSFIGMEAKDIAIAGQTVINVQLSSSTLALDEIIITGVVAGTQRKKLGFTVEKIGAESLEKVPVSNIATSLEGKMSGVRVSKSSGAPGADADIQLRGATTIYGSSNPLIIIDGILTEGGLSDINSDDIESIEIVKGAAASSLYGSRAANGVINITTKKGSSLDAGTTQVVFRSEVGQSYIPFIPKKTKTTANVVETVDGVLTVTDNPSADGVFDNPYPTITDPAKQFFNAGFYTTQNLSLRGNSKDAKTSFFSSFQYNDEVGVVKLTDGNERMSIRTNIDHWITDKMKFSTSNLYTRSIRDHRADNIWDNFYYAAPNADFLADNEDGTPYNIAPSHTNPQLANPLYNISNSTNEEKRNRFLGNYQLEYNPAECLQLKGAYGIDRFSTNSLYLQPKGLLRAGQTSLTTGEIIRETSSNIAQNLQFDALLKKQFGDLNAKLKLQYLYESNTYEFQGGSGTNLAMGSMSVPSLELASENIDIYSESEAVVANNIAGILYLDYKDKYIVDALIRRDGVSLFGANERWQTFYRMSGAWRVTEDFKMEGIQEMKLRASYGVAGLRPVYAAQYDVFSLTDGTIGSLTTLGNADLKPSFSKELEIGLDVNFLDRFELTLNYSKAVNTDQILEVPLSPVVTGATKQWQNAGELEANALEFSLRANVINKTDFSWDLALLGDKITQKVNKLNMPGYSLVSGGIFRVEEGENFGVFYGRKWAKQLSDVANQLPDGEVLANYFVVNNEGFVVRTETIGTISEEPIQIKDENGTEVSEVIGDVNPDLNLSISSNLRYKNLNFYVLLSGQLGGDAYNHMRRYMISHNVSEILDQTGKSDNAVKSINYYNRLTTWNNEYFIEDATHMTIKEVAVNYTFKKDVVNKIFGSNSGIDNINIGVVGRDLFTFTKYTGFSPRAGKSEEGLDSNILKFDISSYPTYATVSASLRVTF